MGQTASSGETETLRGAMAGVYTPPELEAVLLQAFSQAPQMIREELNIARKDASRWRGSATYLPEVHATYNIGGFHEIRDSVNSSDATRVGAVASLTASHPLYYWGAWDAQRKLGILDEEQAINQAVIAFINYCREMRGLYYRMVEQEMAAEVAETQVAIKQEELNRARTQLDQERITPDVFREAELAYLAADLQSSRAQADFEESLATFRQATGELDFAVTMVDLPGTLPPVDISTMEAHLEAYRERGYIDTVLGEEAMIANKMIDEQLVINRSRAKPNFNASASVQQAPYENSRGSYELQTIFFAGISGRWNIFDRDETRDRKRELLTARRLVEAEQRIQRDSVVTQAQSQLRILRLQARKLELTGEQVALQERQVALVRDKVDAGTEDPLNLQKAESNLLESRLENKKAATAIATAYETFYNLLGQDRTVAAFRRQIETTPEE